MGKEIWNFSIFELSDFQTLWYDAVHLWRIWNSKINLYSVFEMCFLQLLLWFCILFFFQTPISTWTALEKTRVPAPTFSLTQWFELSIQVSLYFNFKKYNLCIYLPVFIAWKKCWFWSDITWKIEDVWCSCVTYVTSGWGHRAVADALFLIFQQ